MSECLPLKLIEMVSLECRSNFVNIYLKINEVGKDSTSLVNLSTNTICKRDGLNDSIQI